MIQIKFDTDKNVIFTFFEQKFSLVVQQNKAYPKSTYIMHIFKLCIFFKLTNTLISSFPKVTKIW